jgi:hypothetical protein
MKAVTCLVCLFFLTGCGSHYWNEFHPKNLTVIYTDRGEEICGSSEACYLIRQDMIICRQDQPESCGRELCHATYGDYQHENECRF